MITMQDVAVPLFQGLLWGAGVAFGLMLVVYLGTRWWQRRAARPRAPGDGEINA